MTTTYATRADGAAARGRRALRIAAATAAAAIAFGPAGAPAREQRSVFHSMPMEPESAFKPVPSKTPVEFARAWIFDDFRAPLADRLDVDGPRVIAADRSGDVAALGTADGAILWRVRLNEPIGVGPQMVLGRVFLSTTAGALLCLDAADGRILWRTMLGAAPVAPPLAAAGRLLVATESPDLVSLDPTEGTILGRLPLPGRPLPLSFGTNELLVGTDHGMVLAVEPATLNVRWRRYVRWPVTAPLLAERKRVYVAVADRTLRCLRLSSGKQVWRQRIGAIATARPMAADGYVYVQCWDDDFYVVSRRSGHLAARIHLDHRLSEDAIRASEYLYVTPFTEGSVVALSLPALTLAGRFNLDTPGEWFTTPPILAGERVAVGWGREAGRILALDVKAAPPKKKEKPGTSGTKEPQAPAAAATPPGP